LVEFDPSWRSDGVICDRLPAISDVLPYDNEQGIRSS